MNDQKCQQKHWARQQCPKRCGANALAAGRPLQDQECTSTPLLPLSQQLLTITNAANIATANIGNLADATPAPTTLTPAPTEESTPAPTEESTPAPNDSPKTKTKQDKPCIGDVCCHGSFETTAAVSTDQQLGEDKTGSDFPLMLMPEELTLDDPSSYCKCSKYHKAISTPKLTMANVVQDWQSGSYEGLRFTLSTPDSKCNMASTDDGVSQPPRACLGDSNWWASWKLPTCHPSWKCDSKKVDFFCQNFIGVHNFFLAGAVGGCLRGKALQGNVGFAGMYGDGNPICVRNCPARFTIKKIRHFSVTSLSFRMPGEPGLFCSPGTQPVDISDNKNFGSRFKLHLEPAAAVFFTIKYRDALNSGPLA